MRDIRDNERGGKAKVFILGTPCPQPFYHEALAARAILTAAPHMPSSRVCPTSPATPCPAPRSCAKQL